MYSHTLCSWDLNLGIMKWRWRDCISLCLSKSISVQLVSYPSCLPSHPNEYFLDCSRGEGSTILQFSYHLFCPCTEFSLTHQPRSSLTWALLPFGAGYCVVGGYPVYCMMFSSIRGLYSLDARSTPRCENRKLSPDLAKWPWCISPWWKTSPLKE